MLIEELDLSPSQRRSATLIGAKYLIAYVDRVVGQVSEEYTDERQRVLRSSIQRRVQLVRDVLAGATVDSAELGYRLEQAHRAVVATGPAADASLRDLARRLERRLLTIAMIDDTVWPGWAHHAVSSAANGTTSCGHRPTAGRGTRRGNRRGGSAGSARATSRRSRRTGSRPACGSR